MKSIVYLDNAATSYPKPTSVIRDVLYHIENRCANPGRSTHAMAAECAELVYETRETIAKFVNYDFPERIIFTHNATYALNVAIKGKIRDNKHIITSDIEHNSVLRPLYKQAEEFGAEISVYDSDLPLREAIVPLIKENTGYLVSSLASNVTGKVIDPIELSMIAREYGLFTIIDASQYIGHLPLDLSLSPFDIVCAPGHKALFGIQGGGFAVFKNPDLLYTILEGGTGTETFNREMPNFLPERYEAGTLNTPAIVSLKSGISFLNSITIDGVREKISQLSDYLSRALEFCGAQIYGCNNGIASFTVPKISVDALVDTLDKSMIATRGGLHCAPLIHKKLGTHEHGAVRVSLSIMNTTKDIDALYKALRSV